MFFFQFSGSFTNDAREKSEFLGICMVLSILSRVLFKTLDSPLHKAYQDHPLCMIPFKLKR